MASVSATGYRLNASVGDTFAAGSATGNSYSLGAGFASSVFVPAVVVSPASLSFASQVVGTSSPIQSVTVRNVGAVPLNLGSPALNGDFVAQVSTCGAPLAPGQTCGIDLLFSPTATGPRTGGLNVATNSPSGPLAVALSGTGQTGAGGGGGGGGGGADIPTLPEWGLILLAMTLLMQGWRRMAR
jgi:hypothetical protein